MKATAALVGSLLLGGMSWVDCQSLKVAAGVSGAVLEDGEVRMGRAGETSVDVLLTVCTTVCIPETNTEYNCVALIRECPPYKQD